jgi:hypothetical protein
MTKTIELWIVAVVAVLIALGGYAWITEHDARIRADATVKASAEKITALQQDKAAVQRTTDAAVTVIQHRAAQVKTPAQAIAAMPTVSNAPLNARPLPDMPQAVAVDAVPLFQELAACRVTDAKLEGCTELRAKDAGITAEKDTQIKALKSKGSFWQRAKQTAEVLAVGAAVAIVAVVATGHAK